MIGRCWSWGQQAGLGVCWAHSHASFRKGLEHFTFCARLTDLYLRLHRFGARCPIGGGAREDQISLRPSQKLGARYTLGYSCCREGICTVGLGLLGRNARFGRHRVFGGWLWKGPSAAARNWPPPRDTFSLGRGPIGSQEVGLFRVPRRACS